MRNHAKNPLRWSLVALALVAGARPVLAQGNAPVTAGVFVDAQQTIVLTPGVFAQLLVKRNAEVASSALAINISQNLLDAENGLYEPVAFSDLRKERRHRLNTVEEQIVSSDLPFLDEKVYSVDLGLKMPLPTGGNAKFAYQVEDRVNNVITSQSHGIFKSEYTGSLGGHHRAAAVPRRPAKSITETESRAAEFDFPHRQGEVPAAGLQVAQQRPGAVLAAVQGATRAGAAPGRGRPDAAPAGQHARPHHRGQDRVHTIAMEVQSMALLRDIEYSRAKQSVLDASDQHHVDAGHEARVGAALPAGARGRDHQCLRRAHHAQRATSPTT